MVEQGGVIYCGSCGALNPRTNHYCSACGHQLVDAYHPSEGLRVYLYCDDSDDNGQPSYLLATGIVERHQATDWSAKGKWRCRIDEWGEAPR